MEANQIVESLAETLEVRAGTVHDVEETKTVEFDRRQWDEWREDAERSGADGTLLNPSHRINKTYNNSEVLKTNIPCHFL